MRCSLCEQEFTKYEPTMNHLKIDDSHQLDICDSCIEKFITWQQGIYAKLFPSTAAKKMFARRNQSLE